ncbi:MAG: glycosyl transferase [Lentisphaerae bacterium RIFOXYB12_FULL_65_16]|nr:MAG: glycosyl transferase [Lentisphaerae bacterium RIFOXYA12_64_32]OGV89321.1 MAG: glycosyl transferase [Lentisphaerae bacterium RIFOXYB12_FULL_65_16]
MKKLIIQIPCYNEEKTLAVALAALPRQVPGFDKVEWLVIDDGSRDATAAVAKANGVDHIVRHVRNRGLARAFMTGLDAALKAGADVIVNTDADNQYNAEDIPKLTQPICDGKAEFVIGARPIQQTQHFSALKKFLQALGSWVVRQVSGTDVLDAPSGFRAMDRTAARRFIVFNSYTYTLETIIQAGRQGIAVLSVPIRTNEDLRPSRLVRSVPSYVWRSCQTIVRIYITYSPFRFFMFLASFPFIAGLVCALNFLYYFAIGQEDRHVPTVVAAGVLWAVGAFLLMEGVLADLLAINRRLLEDVRWRLSRLEEQVPGASDQKT